jgi:Uma2 family endonuclease
MAILEHEVRAFAGSNLTGLKRHAFTRDEFNSADLAAALGDRRVELIEGEIIDMAPIGDSHAALTDPLAALLRAAFGPSFSVRSQVPIALGDDTKPSEPQPDVAVVTGSWRDYIARKPGPADIKLLVEIADTSLNADQSVKAALYAAAAVPEYWVVNLIDCSVEVYRDPSGTGYVSRKIYRPGESISPLFAPGASLAVAEFMP